MRRHGHPPDNPSATDKEPNKTALSPSVADARWRPRITSDYWRIWHYLAEAAGLEVWLVNARDVKHLPGRSKTDRLDCVVIGQRPGGACSAGCG